MLHFAIGVILTAGLMLSQSFPDGSLIMLYGDSLILFLAGSYIGNQINT